MKELAAYWNSPENLRFQGAYALQPAGQFSGACPPISALPELIKIMSILLAPRDGLVPLPWSYMSEGLQAVAMVNYPGDNGNARCEKDGSKPLNMRCACLRSSDSPADSDPAHESNLESLCLERPRSNKIR